jgi:hypothetical protein
MIRNKTLFHINRVTAGIFRLLLCKRSYTLYIGILFVNLSYAQTKINDTITHDGYSGISIYDFIESYKDSVIQDSDIKLIRMINPFCTSDHGGTFDVYDCKTYLDKELIRHHTYGSRIEFQYNDDRYYKDGKLIKWIKAEELKNEVEGKSYVKIHIYEM